MKECSKCRYLCREGYEDYYYICELFGEDIPDWAQHHNGDCCLLKYQEVNKLIKLAHDFLFIGSSKELDEYGYPKWTKEDEEHNVKAKKNYDAYIEELKDRCAKRQCQIKFIK